MPGAQTSEPLKTTIQNRCRMFKWTGMAGQFTFFTLGVIWDTDKRCSADEYHENGYTRNRPNEPNCYHTVLAPLCLSALFLCIAIPMMFLVFIVAAIADVVMGIKNCVPDTSVQPYSPNNPYY